MKRDGNPAVYVRLPLELRQRLAHYAQTTGVTAPEAIRQLLDQHLPPHHHRPDPNQLDIEVTQ